MQNANEPRSVLPAMGVLAALMTVTSFSLLQLPFQTSRPGNTVSHTMSSESLEYHPATLTEDPFEVVQLVWQRGIEEDSNVSDDESGKTGVEPEVEPDAESAADSDAVADDYPLTDKDWPKRIADPVELPVFNRSLENIRNSECSALSRSDDSTTPPEDCLMLVLGVMAPSGMTIETREKRRRQRYALVSALASAGLSAQRPEHIGILDATGFHSATTQGYFSDHERVYLPFETYTLGRPFKDNQSLATRAVTVLWLPEGQFTPGAITNISCFMHSVVPDSFVSAARAAGRETFATVIGPASSGGLVDILNNQEVCPRIEPRPLELTTSYEFMRSPDWTERLMTLLTDYLDKELLDARRSELQQCLSGAYENGEFDSSAPLACLDASSLGSVDDSDPDWRNTMKDEWVREILAWSELYTLIPQELAVGGAGADQLVSLIENLNDSDPAAARSCLTQASTEFEANQDPLAFSFSLSNCEVVAGIRPLAPKPTQNAMEEALLESALVNASRDEFEWRLANETGIESERIDGFLNITNGYLDDSLTLEEDAALRECFVENNAFATDEYIAWMPIRVLTCLTEPAVIQKLDSNTSWHRWVTRAWFADYASRSLEDLNERLVWYTDAYLDSGLSSDQSQWLRECLLTEANQNGIGPMSPGLDPADDLMRTVAVACLGGVPMSGIVDSDPNWQSIVLSYWQDDTQYGSPDSNPSQDLSLIRESEKTSAERRPPRVAQEARRRPDTAILMINARATAPENWGVKGAEGYGTRTSPSRRLRSDAVDLALNQIRDAGYVYRSVIANDDETIEQLTREFRERGIQIESAHTKVAAVIEMGTTYGTAVRDMLAERMGPNTVETYGYIRGIDGLDAQTRVSRSSADSNRASATIQPAEGELERAAGSHQFDYVRRLAEKIRARDNELRSRNLEGGYRAIGILGIDVYDKQLIIEALRPQFPNVLFFTTDLDARLLDTRYSHLNRNILIASAYGLTVHDNISSRQMMGMSDVIPPTFRDSYQSAMFMATKLAVLNDAERERALFGTEMQAPSPRLFEVGRGKAIDITQTNPCRFSNGCLAGEWSAGVDTTAEIVHGPVGWIQYAPDLGILGVFEDLLLHVPILILLGFSIARLTRLPAMGEMLKSESSSRDHPDPAEFVKNERDAYVKSIAILSSVFLLSFIFLHSQRLLPNGEPLLIMDGISSWPALTIRLQVLVMGIVFVLLICGRFKDNCRIIEERFHFDRAADDTDEQTMQINMGRWTRKIFGAHLERAHNWKKPSKKAFSIWQTYRQYCRYRPRMIRSVLLAILLLLLVAPVLTAFLRPDPFFRGSYWDELIHLHNLDEFIRISAIVVSVFVIALFIDVACMCRLLIRALIYQEADFDDDDWPEFLQFEQSLVPDWMRKIDLITRHTEVVTPMILMPFALLFLMSMARNPYFDGWTWTLPILSLYVFFSALLLTWAFLLQSTAEKARSRAVMELNRYKTNLLSLDAGKSFEERQMQISRIDLAVEYIVTLRRGAFVPWFRHPILQALALPFASLLSSVLLKMG